MSARLRASRELSRQLRWGGIRYAVHPLGAGAQAEEEGATSEPNLQEPAPPSEAVPEEPALELKLDTTGVDVAPSPLRTPDGYTLKEMEPRVRRAKIGLGSSASAFFAGGMCLGCGT